MSRLVSVVPRHVPEFVRDGRVRACCWPAAFASLRGKRGGSREIVRFAFHNRPCDAGCRTHPVWGSASQAQGDGQWEGVFAQLASRSAVTIATPKGQFMEERKFAFGEFSFPTPASSMAEKQKARRWEETHLKELLMFKTTQAFSVTRRCCVPFPLVKGAPLAG